MKKVLLFTLLTNFVIAHDYECDNLSSKDCLQNSPTHQISLPTDQIDNEISRADIKKPANIWTEPLIIDAHSNISTFVFTENIVYKPAANYSYPSAYWGYPAAIIIAKDNVTINLAGFSLSMDPNSGSNFMINNPTFGISILPGVKNIKIISSTITQPSQKGVITGFPGYGIYMLGSSQIFNSYDIFASYIKNVFIENIAVIYNIAGIYASYVFNINITDTDVNYNFSPRPTYGIYFATVQAGTIQNCNANQNWSYNNIAGICLQDTINVVTKNCVTSLNRSLQNGNAYGINITATTGTTSYGNQILNCHATSNLCSFVTGKQSVGFYINAGSRHNAISESQTFLSKHGPAFSAPAPSIPPKGFGIKIENSSSNEVTKNRSAYHLDYGFFDGSTISTTLYTANISGFNPTGNYYITVPTATGSAPLPTVTLYSDDVNSYTQSTFANVEFKLHS